MLSTTLPNFIAEPLGPTNGPLTQSTVSQFGGQSQAVANVGEQLANGDLTGYVRVWTHAPPDGDAVEIMAIHFSNPADIPSALSGFADAASQADASQFTVPNIPGAMGRETTLTTTRGTLAKAYVVTFSNAENLFVTYGISESGDLTSADAVTVASEQAAHVGGATVPSSSSGSSPAYVAGEVFGGVLLIAGITALIIVIVRRTRRNDELHHGHPLQEPTPSTVGWSAPRRPSGSSLPTGTPQQPGWEPIGTNWNEQAYWDGQAWTARRAWSGGRWGPEMPVVYSEDRT